MRFCDITLRVPASYWVYGLLNLSPSISTCLIQALISLIWMPERAAQIAPKFCFAPSGLLSTEQPERAFWKHNSGQDSPFAASPQLQGERRKPFMGSARPHVLVPA